MLGKLIPENKKRNVYLDNAAATKLDPKVLQKMLPSLKDNFGNPSALHKKGREAMDVIFDARKKVAGIFGCQPEQIIFTGSGTESDNMALFGIANAYQKNGKHIISNKIEHHAVLHPLEKLKKQNFDIKLLSPDKQGQVKAKDILKTLHKDTILVSIMYANNEIGTINNIAEIGRAILKYKQKHGLKPTDPPFFHTDACQAAASQELNIEKLHVDLMTINGSKIYGPKGVGVLFLRKGLKLGSIIFGGSQEFRKRPGTENVANIVGIAEALELAQKNKQKENQRQKKLRDWFISEIQKQIPKTLLNGDATERLPNNTNISFLDVEGESVILYLDEYNISCSTGSACTSASLDPSHVISGLGYPYEYAHASVRFSLGKDTTKKDLQYVLDILKPVVEFLRKVSPIKISTKNK